MYTPNAFRETDTECLVAFIREHSLGMLITQSAAGLQANPVPMLVVECAGRLELQGHLARANPQWRDLASGTPALVVFNGPNAYVSPNYYPSKARNPAVVPTWNYLCVQARGTPRIIDDPEPLHDLVSRLTHQHEANQPHPWAVEDAPADYIERMLKAIVGFSIAMEQLEGKRKLSQNRSLEDRQGVQRALDGSPMSTARALAEAMAGSR
ncbi:FMN-binding negative transcriptional regulator [Pseudomonas sp. DC3000-4b1]|uniref:FMN-binding negative transcriptional regulator n=1 Tax=unclassified Pseudomonas TaxID=196821 RepID=UPI003CF76FE4